jgi:hypothetical protein
MAAETLESVQRCEAGIGPIGHCDRSRVVQTDDLGSRSLQQVDLQPCNQWPIRVGGRAGIGVATRDDGLLLIRPRRHSLHRGGKYRVCLLDRGEIPARSILVLKQDEIAREVGPCRQRHPGVTDLSLGPHDPLGSVAPGNQNADAISGVVRPQTNRSVRATCVSRSRAGWQQSRTSRRCSSSVVARLVAPMTEHRAPIDRIRQRSLGFL